MLAELARGIDAIEARRKAQARRNAPQKRAAWAVYEAARERFAGEAHSGPSVLVAAMFGLDDGPDGAPDHETGRDRWPDTRRA